MAAQHAPQWRQPPHRRLVPANRRKRLLRGVLPSIVVFLAFGQVLTPAAQLTHLPDNSLPFDFVIKEILFSEAQLTLNERLGRNYFNSRVGGSTPLNFDLRRRTAEVNGFPNLEDSIFTHRPNVLVTSVGVRNLGTHRLSWAGLVMGCYSLADQASEWTDTSWAYLPRPVSLSTQRNIPNDGSIMRTWASTPEMNGALESNLTWCLSPPDFVEKAGIELNYTVAATNLAAVDSKSDSLESAMRNNIQNPQEMIRLMRASYETALRDRSTEASSIVRMRVSGVGLAKVQPGLSVTDFSRSDLNDGKDGIFQKTAENLLKAVNSFFLNHWGRQTLTDFTIEVEPRAVTETELLLAIAAATWGTVVEDLLLQKILEGRTSTIPPEEFQVGHIIRKAWKFICFTSVLVLASADMLPIILVYSSEKKRAGWVGQALRSYYGAEGMNGRFRQGDKIRHTAHAIHVTIETWRIQVLGTRERIAGIFVAIAILLHVLMLGYRASFVLYSYTRVPLKRPGIQVRAKMHSRLETSK